jgi:hypothetical protein
MILRRLHAIAAALFVATIVVQVLLAGLALVELGGSGDFSTHVAFGFEVIGIAALVLVVTALLARRPRRDVLVALALIVLYVVQTLLPGLRSSVPVVAALHPLNAMLLFLMSVLYARQAWRVGWPRVARRESPVSPSEVAPARGYQS